MIEISSRFAYLLGQDISVDNVNDFFIRPRQIGTSFPDDPFFASDTRIAITIYALLSSTQFDGLIGSDDSGMNCSLNHYFFPRQISAYNDKYKYIFY